MSQYQRSTTPLLLGKSCKSFVSTHWYPLTTNVLRVKKALPGLPDLYVIHRFPRAWRGGARSVGICWTCCSCWTWHFWHCCASTDVPGGSCWWCDGGSCCWRRPRLSWAMRASMHSLPTCAPWGLTQAVCRWSLWHAMTHLSNAEMRRKENMKYKGSCYNWLNLFMLFSAWKVLTQRNWNKFND